MKLFKSIWLICALTGVASHISDTIEGMQRKMAGGYFIDIDKAPYQILIRVNDEDKCGGSLIKPDLVVTAAHCFSDGISVVFKPSQVLVLAGSANKMKMKQMSKAKLLKVHEDYKLDEAGVAQENDIALVKLQRKFTINQRVKTISLRNQPTGGGVTCYVSGWAAEIHNKIIFESRYLKSAKVITMSFEECNASYSAVMPPLNPNVVCAGVLKDVRDICLGDSGGPLVCDNTLAGLLSFDQNCFDPSIPEVYTDIYKYEKWINANGSSKTALSVLMAFILEVITLYLFI